MARLTTLCLGLALFLVFGEFQALKMEPRKQHPQIISHRGACGYVPEHSLAAYQLAIDLQTDYIEPDLCLSKDGVFVAMHDLLLDDTTDVATSPYADRKTTKMVEGQNMTGYFISDFTYAELQTLRLKQRLPFRTTLYNGLFQIPTFTDIMQLAQSNYANTGRLVGIYPELKHPAYFKSLGFPMEDMFLEALQQGGYETSGDSVPTDLTQVLPVIVQCFDPKSLQYLRTKTSIPLLQLVEYVPPYKLVKSELDQIASYAQILGAAKQYYVNNTRYEEAVETIDYARSKGLYIVPWTFRADNGIMPQFNNNFALEEMYYFCCLGVDSVFSEFPDRSRETINLMFNFTTWDTHPSKRKCNINCAKPSSWLA